MLDKKMITGNLIALAVLGILLLVFGFAGIGLAALLISVVDLIVALIYLIAGNRKRGLTLLVCCGVLLLVGFSICTAIPFTVH
jgi:hypothetical protein